MNKSSFFLVLLGALFFSGVILTGLYYLPWQNIDWGRIQLSPIKTITVIGEAESLEKSQIANFTAGFSAVNDNKDTAVNEVNQKTEVLISLLKQFGISSENIKTQNLSIYQDEETYWEDNRQKRRPGQWRVNNSVDITLYNVDQAAGLADLLAQSGATNVYGPNFSLDDTAKAQDALLNQAVENAQNKANILVQKTGASLGKIISISEGYQPTNIYRGYEGMGGGGGAIEPGTGTVSKTVTVVFEVN